MTTGIREGFNSRMALLNYLFVLLLTKQTPLISASAYPGLVLPVACLGVSAVFVDVFFDPHQRALHIVQHGREGYLSGRSFKLRTTHFSTFHLVWYQSSEPYTPSLD